MFGEMGHQFIIEQAGAIMLDQAIDVLLVGLGDSQGRLEMLARQGKAMPAVVRGADDHEQRGLASLEDLLERPRIGTAAASIVHVRDQHGPQPVIRPGLAGQAGTIGPGEQVLDHLAQSSRLRLVVMDARRRTDRALDKLAIARAVQEERLVQSRDQPLNQLQRNQLAAELRDRLGLDVAQAAFAVKELQPLQFQFGHLDHVVAQAQLVPDQEVGVLAILGTSSQVRTDLRTFEQGHCVINRAGHL